MRPVFEYTDYREVIEDYSKEKRVPYRSLAMQNRIHASYFSRVMVGKAEFSQSQLYNIGKSFELNDSEIDYLLILGQAAVTTTAEEKKYFSKKISNIRDEALKVVKDFKLRNVNFVEASTNLDEYYREAITAEIHMLLTISKYCQSPFLLAKKLNLTDQKIKIELDKLERLKLIKRKGNQVTLVEDNIHLDESSSLSPQNHINWRIEAIKNISKRETQHSDYHLSVAFSCDEDTKIRLKQLFKDFVKQAQKEVGLSKNQDDVYHIIFDLF